MYSKKYHKFSMSNKIDQNGGNHKFDKEIYFIRHGKTSWNEQGKIQGQEADTELSEVGIKESNQTGKYLKKFRLNGIQFDCILSSPLKRCSDTAKLIANHIGFDSAKINYMDDLIELKKGNMSGLTYYDKLIKDLSRMEKDALNKISDPIERNKVNLPYYDYKFYIDNNIDNTLGITGIEKYEEIFARVNNVVEYIKNTDCKKILIISHSGYLDFLLKTIFNIGILPRGNMNNGKNCSICYCTMNNGVFTMVSPQNTEHLSMFII